MAAIDEYQLYRIVPAGEVEGCRVTGQRFNLALNGTSDEVQGGLGCEMQFGQGSVGQVLIYSPGIVGVQVQGEDGTVGGNIECQVQGRVSEEGPDLKDMIGHNDLGRGHDDGHFQQGQATHSPAVRKCGGDDPLRRQRFENLEELVGADVMHVPANLMVF